MRNILLSLIIFLAQACGVVVVGIGLYMFCVPICLIYSGVVAFAFGHLLYMDMESEEVKK